MALGPLYPPLYLDDVVGRVLGRKGDRSLVFSFLTSTLPYPPAGAQAVLNADKTPQTPKEAPNLKISSLRERKTRRFLSCHQCK